MILPGIDQFAWPWALAALALLPPLAFIAARRARGTRADILYGAERFTHDAPRGWRTRLTILAPLLRGLALAALIVAAARPQSVTGDVRTRSKGIAIQLVIDRSGSMAEEMTRGRDQVRRIDVVKEVARDFVLGDQQGLAGRAGDIIGLVTFAKYADTICPLVQEHDVLAERIGQIELVGVRSEDGTAIGEAVALAAARLRRAEEEIRALNQAEPPTADTPADPKAQTSEDDDDFRIASKAIVLLTDGQSNAGEIDPLTAADLAKGWNIRIYTIGIGGERIIELGGIRRRLGPGVDEQTLSQMAESTGGRYWLADDADALRDIYAEIDALERTEVERSSATNTDERFHAFAAAALLAVVIEAALRALVLRRLP